VVEAATFRPTVVRRSSQRLGLRTEASARFEKGLDTPRVDAAVDLFLHLLGRIAPGAILGKAQDAQVDPTSPAEVDVDLGSIGRRLGQPVTADDATGILTSLGFTVTGSGDRLRVGVPTWRSTGDVSMPHDIFEEIARIRGFDSLPVTSLSVDLKPVRSLNRRPLDRTIREQLATRAGLQEVVTYPWAADGTLHAAGFDKHATVRFEGAPAPDRGSLRPSLLPNLLEAVAANLRYTPSFGLFEVGMVFTGGPMASYRGTFEAMPTQARHLAAVFVGRDGAELFRTAKGALEMLYRHCHLTDLQFAPADAETGGWADSSARLAVTAHGTTVGTLGLLTTRCRRLAGIGAVQVACFELDLDDLSAYPSRENRYRPLAELPESDFDLSVVVADHVHWDRIAPVVEGVDPLVSQVVIVDEFRGDWVPEGHRSLSLRVTLQPRETTLAADTIAAIRDGVLAALTERFGAYLRESPPAEGPRQ
jgi:phenylalanyl-tRNA synthetase beta chain